MRRVAIGWSITRSILPWSGGPVAGFWSAWPPTSPRSDLASSVPESASGFLLSYRCSTVSHAELTFTGYARTEELPIEPHSPTLRAARDNREAVGPAFLGETRG